MLGHFDMNEDVEENICEVLLRGEKLLFEVIHGRFTKIAETWAAVKCVIDIESS